MATVEELAVAALARGATLGSEFPSTRSVMYRRIGLRQQQLFAIAASINPDYFGTYSDGLIEDGEVNLRSMADPVPQAESVSRVEIADHGTNLDYVDGQVVHIVSVTDPNVALPPRAFLRDGIITQVGIELDGVASLRVYYSRQPLPIGAADGAVDIDLPGSFQELLVVDLAKYLFAQLLDVDPGRRAAAVAAMDQEEKSLLNDFDHQLRAQNAALESRFARPPFAPRRTT